MILETIFLLSIKCTLIDIRIKKVKKSNYGTVIKLGLYNIFRERSTAYRKLMDSFSK